jgi:hypothetical protein
MVLFVLLGEQFLIFIRIAVPSSSGSRSPRIMTMLGNI